MSSDDENNLGVAYQDEPKEDYKRGGYCVVHVGQRFGKYKIMKKLGWGTYSTVWQAQSSEQKKNVALKIIKSGRYYRLAAKTELSLLLSIDKKNAKKYSEKIIHLIGNFQHRSENGLHICLVFPMFECSLYHLLESYPDGLGELAAKKIVKDIAKGLYFLHYSCGYAHLDVKPENILVSSHDVERPDTWKITIADLGGAEKPSNTKNSREKVQTVMYRAPEVILRHGYDFKADVWSLGCLCFELYTGVLLFNPLKNNSASLSEQHLAEFMLVLGDFPKTFIRKYNITYQKFFRKDNVLLNLGHIEQIYLLDVLMTNEETGVTPSEECTNFILNALAYFPRKRPTIRKILSDDWFKNK